MAELLEIEGLMSPQAMIFNHSAQSPVAPF
jgi:hypothetical protein